MSDIRKDSDNTPSPMNAPAAPVASGSTASSDAAIAAWEETGLDERAAGEALVVDVAGFEGPLDLLLALARTQKVDLHKISVLALADQYLSYIAEVQKLRLELAADYLVMAAWLAYLKSRMLLPRADKATDEPTPDALAAALAFRLMRLEAMRNAAAQLFTRKRLGRDVFTRGMPEGVRTIRERQFSAVIYDLIKAYAEQRKRTTVKRAHVVKKRLVWSIKDARQRLERMVGTSAAGSWLQLDLFLEQYLPGPELGRTALASSFGATLEMARDGLIEIRQAAPFAPIYMRRRGTGAEWERVG
jgi:segregation and condensation protein A